MTLLRLKTSAWFWDLEPLFQVPDHPERQYHLLFWSERVRSVGLANVPMPTSSIVQGSFLLVDGCAVIGQADP